MSGKGFEKHVEEILGHEAQLRRDLRALERDISEAQRYLLTLTEHKDRTLELLKAVDDARARRDA